MAPCCRVAGCAAALIVGFGACDETTAPPPLAVRLIDTHAWSGGEAMLASSVFAPSAPLPIARSTAATLDVRRIDDSTIAVRLPDGNGPLPLTIEASGYLPFDGSVVLHGFRGSEDGPLLSGFLQTVPGQPWVLGAGDAGLVEVDVRTGAVLRSWPDTVHSPDCIWGVGPSVRPGHYVLFGKAPGGACTHPWVWQYGPTLVRVDSLWERAGQWAFAEIGPGGVIAGADDNLYISPCDASGCGTPVQYMSQAGSLTGITIGATAKRAVLNSFERFVVDAASGDTVYRLAFPAGGHTEGAAFSAGDDTIYAVAGGTLLMVASAGGTPLDTLALPGVSAFDIARDAGNSRLYVAALAGDVYTETRPQLIILAEGTLAPVAVLRAPAAESLSLTEWHQFRLVPDPAQSAVYVVATKQLANLHGVRARIMRFDLLP